jgi:hypothetical protein
LKIQKIWNGKLLLRTSTEIHLHCEPRGIQHNVRSLKPV